MPKRTRIVGANIYFEYFYTTINSLMLIETKNFCMFIKTINIPKIDVEIHPVNKLQPPPEIHQNHKTRYQGVLGCHQYAQLPVLQV
jgi:hypothetical protein